MQCFSVTVHSFLFFFILFSAFVYIGLYIYAFGLGILDPALTAMPLVIVCNIVTPYLIFKHIKEQVETCIGGQHIHVPQPRPQWSIRNAKKARHLCEVSGVLLINIEVVLNVPD